MAILRRVVRAVWLTMKPEPGDGKLCLKATLIALALTIPIVLVGELLQWLVGG